MTESPVTAPAKVVPGSSLPRLSWTWLFPLLALGVTVWLWWEKEQQKGPLIEITFAEAPGMEPGKTHLVYRGVKAGEVKAVRLENELSQVVVTVQLLAYASSLAREGTQFWIEKPVVSLHGVAGLEALIQGNSIRALVTNPDGKTTSSFAALDEPPLSDENAPTLEFALEADSIPFITRGTPVFHRGTQVGWISHKELNAEGKAVAGLVIRERYAASVRTNSRFWLISAASLSASPGQVQLNLPSIAAILDGGVAFETFETPGDQASAGSTFELSANEIAARADGPRLTIDFPSAIAMRAGETRIAYLGQPVGIVETLEPAPTRGSIRATVRVAASLAPLVDSSSRFYFVRPAITWKGITGLETLVAGPYIAFEPGDGGEPCTSFVGVSSDEAMEEELSNLYSGLSVTVRAPAIGQLDQGAPVFYGGLQVGAVLRKQISSEGESELVLGFLPNHSHLVRQDSRFWRVPATSITAGPGTLQVTLEGFSGLLHGGITFANWETSSTPSPAATPHQVFELFPSATLAQAISPPIRLTLSNARGLLAGQTQLRYLGLPVGVVEKVEIKPDRVIATARFFPGYDFLRRSGSEFAVIRPQISLQGATGLESLISGVFINCSRGNGPGFAEEFTIADAYEEVVVAQPGLELSLTATQTRVHPGAAITYNGQHVGEITHRSLSPDGSTVVLKGKIYSEFAHLVQTNSIFWDASDLKAKIGFVQLSIQTPGILAASGQIAFYNPPKGGEPAPAKTNFSLATKPPRQFK